MGLWAKSVLIFNALREHGQQSVRRLAECTGLSKSSVHRHLQAINRRDRYPESSLWETEAGRNWLIRLVVATLLVFGLKRGVGAETLRACLINSHYCRKVTHMDMGFVDFQGLPVQNWFSNGAQTCRKRSW